MVENTLRVRRAEKGPRGVTQLGVAKATGIERNRYWRIEHEGDEPTPAEIKKLARYFRCSASILFPSLASTPTANDGATA